MIKLKDLTCEKCFYARKSNSSFAVSENLVECRRHPGAAMKTMNFGCGEGVWIADNKKINETEKIMWSDFDFYRGDEPYWWKTYFELCDPWWIEE